MIVIWNSRSGVPVRTIFGAHPGGVLSLDMTHDAMFIATLGAGAGQSLKIWEWTIKASKLPPWHNIALHVASSTGIPMLLDIWNRKISAMRTRPQLKFVAGPWCRRMCQWLRVRSQAETCSTAWRFAAMIHQSLSPTALPAQFSGHGINLPAFRFSYSFSKNGARVTVSRTLHLLNHLHDRTEKALKYYSPAISAKEFPTPIGKFTRYCAWSPAFCM